MPDLTALAERVAEVRADYDKRAGELEPWKRVDLAEDVIEAQDALLAGLTKYGVKEVAFSYEQFAVRLIPNPDYTGGTPVPEPIITEVASKRTYVESAAADVNKLAGKAGNSYHVLRAEVVSRVVTRFKGTGELCSEWTPDSAPKPEGEAS